MGLSVLRWARAVELLLCGVHSNVGSQRGHLCRKA